MQATSKIELTTQPVVTVRGVTCGPDRGGPVRYIASVIDRGTYKAFCLEQLCRNGERGPAGTWALATLLRVDRRPMVSSGQPFEVSNRLAIDYGQQWYVENMIELLTEAVALLVGVP